MGWKMQAIQQLNKEGRYDEALALSQNTAARFDYPQVEEQDYTVETDDSPLSVSRKMLGGRATEQQVYAFAQSQGWLTGFKPGQVLRVLPTFLRPDAAPSQGYVRATMALGNNGVAGVSQGAAGTAPTTGQAPVINNLPTTTIGIGDFGLAKYQSLLPKQSSPAFIPAGASPSTPSVYAPAVGLNASGGVSIAPSTATQSGPSSIAGRMVDVLSNPIKNFPAQVVPQDWMRAFAAGPAPQEQALTSIERSLGGTQAPVTQPTSAATHDQAWQFRMATWVQDTLVRNTLNMFGNARVTGNPQDLPAAVPPGVFGTIASSQNVSPDDFAVAFGYAFDASVNAWVRGISASSTSYDNYSSLYSYLRNPSKPTGVHPLRAGTARGEQPAGAQYNYGGKYPQYQGGYGGNSRGYNNIGLVNWRIGFG